MAISKRLRYEILRRDNYTCRYCGRRSPDVELAVDHVVPEALGGPDVPPNLVTACQDCNSGKSANAPDAAVVDDVAMRAEAWSAAMTQAAAERTAHRDGRAFLHNEFETEWNSWKINGVAVPISAGWRVTVDKYLDAGLSLADILELKRQRSQRRQQLKDTYRAGFDDGIASARRGDL